jgi:hypothetical protein
MSFVTKAAVFAAGYAVGHPEGRRRIAQLREQVTELGRHPQVKQARERAWDVAGDQALAVRNRLIGRSRSTKNPVAPDTDTHPIRPSRDHTGGDPAVDTAAAGTAAAADGLRATPAANEPLPPVPPARPIRVDAPDRDVVS